MNTLLELPVAPIKKEGGSSASLSVLFGEGLTVWFGDSAVDTRRDLLLQISPDNPVIIGRAEGGEVPYLDPAYRSTTILPDTGQTILKGNGDGRDTCVSRAHFMLRFAVGGILLVNGVPKRGGGIRPPRNGTRLIAPTNREMRPEEELLIESDTAVTILLPNGTSVRIGAA